MISVAVIAVSLLTTRAYVNPRSATAAIAKLVAITNRLIIVTRSIPTSPGSFRSGK